VPPEALAPLLAEPIGPVEPQGSLLTKGTVDAYIAAIIELWQAQVAHGNRNMDHPRGIAVRGFLEQCARQRGQHNREHFYDRGKDGIQAEYSTTE
jgi:hypothetical protein